MKGIKSMSKERLVSSFNESKSMKESAKNFDGARKEKMKIDFNELRERLSIIFQAKNKRH